MGIALALPIRILFGIRFSGNHLRQRIIRVAVAMWVKGMLRGGRGEAIQPPRLWRSLLVLLALVSPVAGAIPFDELQQSTDPRLLLDWGKRYFYGVQAPQSIDHAIRLYCTAARLGNGEAQYRLGEIYGRTLTGKRDEVLAAAWFLRAALSRYGAAKAQLVQWDLTGLEIPAEPECVLSARMVARTLPRTQPDRATPDASTAETAARSVGQDPVVGRRLNGKAVTRAEVEGLVRTLAPGFGLNPELVLAVVEVESNFSPTVQSPKQAQGLMQLIPATARRFGVADPWDPHQNLRGGMAYLRWLLDHFGGDLRLALAGYNAGEGAVRDYGGIPPFAETQNYVRRIARVLGVSEEGLSLVETRPQAAAPALGAPTREGLEADG